MSPSDSHPAFWTLTKQLHQLLVDYEDQGGYPDLHSFLNWCGQMSQSAGVAPAPEPGYDSGANILFGNPDGTAGQLISRLGRMTRMASREAVSKAGLSGMDEFWMLSTIGNQPGLGKTELCTKAVVEPTTGYEILKRFRRNGWTAEAPNPADRRSRRITLTAAGKEILQRCYENHAQLPPILIGLTELEQQTLIGLLDRLNRLHTVSRSQNR